MDKKVSDLTAAEIAWVDENVARARELVATTARSLRPDERLSPEGLDAAWSEWIAGWRIGEDPNPVINALGLALGKYLVDRLELSWKVVTDEYGTEIAIHGQPGDIFIFPTNLVAKRFESRTTGFFVPVAAEIETSVTKLRGRRH